MNTIEDFFTISDFDERIAKDKAEELFNNYYLTRGEYKFYFLEVEFYFFSKNHQDILIKDGKEKPFVYPRHCEKGGQFLLHTSGVDLCFKGILNEKGEGSGGGILIRSLLMEKEGKEYLIAGPWDCYSTLFSYTSNEDHIKLEKIPQKDNKHIEIQPCQRKIAASAKYSMANKFYAFYNKKFCSDGGKFTKIDGTILPRYNYLCPDQDKTNNYYPNFRNRDNAPLQSNK